MAAPQPATPGTAYLIAFAGINGAIDSASAAKRAAAQGRTLRIFGYHSTTGAVAFLRRADNPQHGVLGFSAGASGQVLAGYVAGLARAGLRPPADCVTVGLYDRSPAYDNSKIQCVNYLDRSGQRHVGEPGTVNLGAKVSHIDPRSGAMARVAALITPEPSSGNYLKRKGFLSYPKISDNCLSRAVTGKCTPPRLPMLGKAIADVLDSLTGSRTAIYDISGHTVYLPNGDWLEAHSGLGPAHDNPRLAYLKNRGPTPPNTYRLTMREKAFHGVRALRLNPLDETRMHGRDGILAHTYMRSGGQSAGCLVFRNYPAFLSAFEAGVVDRIAVVARLAGIGSADLAPPAHLERQALAGRAHRQRHARVRYARHVRGRG